MTPRCLNLGDLGNIRAAARHLLALIDDILDVSKIEAGKMELFIEPFDARELLDEVVGDHRPAGGPQPQRGSSSTYEVEPRRPVHTDRTKLKQVALNLLSNACKFTHDGQVRLAVRRVRGPGRRVVAPRGRGLGDRDRQRTARRAVPAVSPGRRVDHPQIRWHGARPVDQQPLLPDDARLDPSHERAGSRLHLHGADPGRHQPGPARARLSWTPSDSASGCL
jgi:hypothetical protein